ncbi:MAG: ParA family protein [Deltaproteobacteria bacterium]|nr:ParA family protein [Myxococcales bacterium]MDP3214682.1 ParA family protein [Deltaproteobacteria bacterium]
MATAKTCSVCGRGFEMKFRYQVVEDGAGARHFCSQKCQQKHLGVDRGAASCTQCAKPFKLEFAWQVLVDDHGTRFMCTQACRDALVAAPPPARATRRIAVFNHKGGTGKTTTAINVAAGLAEKGLKVLLVDVDPQGNVGVSLGIRGETTLYHVLVLGTDPRDVAVNVRANLDVITSNETLAAAEVYLASRPARDRVLRDRMLGSDAYDVVVLDCSPSLSLLNQNALCYADSVLIPVSCDYLALVGVKQCVRTLGHVHEQLKHPVYILGVIPTFYDARHKLGREVTDTLQKKFEDLCFPPVRANMKLREAPAARQTIFEYAPDSHGAEDYRTVVERVLQAVQRDQKSVAPVTGEIVAPKRAAAAAAALVATSVVPTAVLPKAAAMEVA